MTIDYYDVGESTKPQQIKTVANLLEALYQNFYRKTITLSIKNQLDLYNEFSSLLEYGSSHNVNIFEIFAKEAESNKKIGITHNKVGHLLMEIVQVLDKDKSRQVVKELLLNYNKYLYLVANTLSDSQATKGRNADINNFFIKLFITNEKKLLRLKEEIGYNNISRIQKNVLLYSTYHEAVSFLDNIVNEGDKKVSNIDNMPYVIKNLEAIDYLFSQKYDWSGEEKLLLKILNSKEDINKFNQILKVKDKLLNSYIENSNTGEEIKIYALNKIIKLKNNKIQHSKVYEFIFKNADKIENNVFKSITLMYLKESHNYNEILSLKNILEKKQLEFTSDDIEEVIGTAKYSNLLNESLSGVIASVFKNATGAERDNLLENMLANTAYPPQLLKEFFTDKELIDVASKNILVDNLFYLNEFLPAQRLIKKYNAQSCENLYIKYLDKLSAQDKAVILQTLLQRDLQNNDIFSFVRSIVERVSIHDENKGSMIFEDFVFVGYLQAIHKYIKENKVIIKNKNIPVELAIHNYPKAKKIAQTIFKEVLDNRLNNLYIKTYNTKTDMPIYKIFDLKANAEKIGSYKKSEGFLKSIKNLISKDSQQDVYMRINNNTEYTILYPQKNAIFTNNKDMTVLDFTPNIQEENAIDKVRDYISQHKNDKIDLAYQLKVDNLIISIKIFMKEIEELKDISPSMHKNYHDMTYTIPQCIEESYKLYNINLKKAKYNNSSEEVERSMLENINLIKKYFEEIKAQIVNELSDTGVKDIKIHNKLLTQSIGGLKP